MSASPITSRRTGSATVDVDTVEQINERVVALLEEMIERNGVDHDDLVSIIFTATSDIHAGFPAAAARTRVRFAPLSFCLRVWSRVVLRLVPLRRRNEPVSPELCRRWLGSLSDCGRLRLRQRLPRKGRFSHRRLLRPIISRHHGPDRGAGLT